MKYFFSILASFLFFLPAHAAIVDDNFESGNLDNWTVATSACSIIYVSTTGAGCASTPDPTHCARSTSANSCSSFTADQTTGSEINPYGYIRFYFQAGLTSSQNSNILSFYSDSTEKASIRIYRTSTTTKLQVLGNTVNEVYNEVASSTWHQLAWQYNSAINKIRIRLDDASLYSQWFDITGSYPANKVRLMNDAALNGFEVDFDDFRTSVTDIFVPYYNIVTPSNGSVIKDFSYWTLSFYAPYSTSTNFGIYMLYGTSAEFPENIESEHIPNTNAPYLYNMSKGAPLSDNTYYAQMVIYDDNDNLVGQSSQIAFVIDNINGNDAVTATSSLFTSTTTLANLSVTCDESSGYFQNSFCKLYQYLFVASASNLNDYRDFKNALANKAPWGYYDLIKNAWNNVGTSTSDELLISSSWSNFDSIIKPISTTLIWFFFLFAMVKILRHANI